MCAFSRLAVAAAVGLACVGPVSGRTADDIPPETFRGADGSLIVLRAPTDGALVLAFYSTECPISNYYSPTLNAVAHSSDSARIRVVGVCIDPDLSMDAICVHAKEYRLGFPVLHDPRGELARRLGVRVTPEVVLFDDVRKIRYQGRIDDQFVARQEKAAVPKTHDLSDAIGDVLAGRDVAVPRRDAVGCPLPEGGAEGARTVTYARDVAPIIDRNCVECHRGGSLAPFGLETYGQARKRSADLASVAADRLMPPWRAEPGFGPAFQHDRSLTSAEIKTLIAWSDAGAPEGDVGDRPTPPTFTEGWRLGAPDLVIEMPEEFATPATGDDIYRCFVIKTDLPGDVFVSGIEYRPGNARVVHHILGYVDATDEARKKDEASAGPGYVCFGGPGVKINNDLGGWAPGVEASVLPDGIGRALPKGSYVIMQVHYHPNGKPEVDRSALGLYFAKTPTRQSFHWSFAFDDSFEIPPGDANFRVTAEREMPTDVVALSVAPHMHKLGKDMTMWAELPSGERVDLIRIDRWNFNWQAQYFFKDRIALPKGTKLKVVAHFDNSSDNPRNPRRSAPQAIRWGEGTDDEMCIGFIGLVKAGQDLTRPGERDDLREILRDEE